MGQGRGRRQYFDAHRRHSHSNAHKTLQGAPGFDGSHNIGHVLFADLVAQREIQVYEWAVCGDLGDQKEGKGILKYKYTVPIIIDPFWLLKFGNVQDHNIYSCTCVEKRFEILGMVER